MVNEDRQLLRRLAGPLLRAFKSRRVVIALSALVVALLVMAMPDLAAVRGELLTLVASLALAILGGYSLSDAARLRNGNVNGNGVSAEELRTLVKELLIELIDEVGEEQPGEGEQPAQTPKEKVNV